MKDLDYVLKSERTRSQEETKRLERVEQFKGIRQKERQITCHEIQDLTYFKAKVGTKWLTISREDFDNIIKVVIERGA